MDIVSLGVLENGGIKGRGGEKVTLVTSILNLRGQQVGQAMMLVAGNTRLGHSRAKQAMCAAVKTMQRETRRGLRTKA